LGEAAKPDLSYGLFPGFVAGWLNKQFKLHGIEERFKLSLFTDLLNQPKAELKVRVRAKRKTNSNSAHFTEVRVQQHLRQFSTRNRQNTDLT